VTTAVLETRALPVLLATADARARPALLRDFVRHFHAGDPVSLVLHAPQPDAAHELTLLTPYLEPLLLDRPEAPDVVIFAVPDGAAAKLEESAFAQLTNAAQLRALVDERSVAERPREQIVVGTGSYRGPGSTLRTFAPGEQIVIGSYTSIAEDVTVLAGGGHRTDTVSTFPFDPCLLGTRFPDGWLEDSGVNRSYVTSKATEIGSDVWIGHGALVSAGVRVGHGAVIASGAVVFRDVPPYALVAGNPAIPVRYRFSKDVVERLLRIRWWDWPEDVVRAHSDWFYRPIAEFLDRFDPIPPEEET
jgi:acetyltransferase-like isoleucine patch superfamily enzyme